jgi:hypothetical protein
MIELAIHVIKDQFLSNPTVFRPDRDWFTQSNMSGKGHFELKCVSLVMKKPYSRMVAVDFVGLQYDLTKSLLKGAQYAMIRLFGSYVFGQSEQCVAILPIVGLLTAKCSF